MSKLTVPSNINNRTLFKEWLNTINAILDEEKEIYDILDTKAPKNHAVAETLYGLGTNTKYGHLKLSDTASSTLNAETGGTAATPKALYDVNSAINTSIEQLETDINDSINTLESTITSELNAIRTDIVENYAIKNHASAYETYGVGTSSLYGHLKLSDIRNENLTEEFGTAATPKALDDVYNDLTELIDGFNINDEFNDIKNALIQINDTTVPAGQDIVLNDITWTPKAEKYHASSETTYGLGTETLYGHLKITSDFANWTDKTSVDTTVSLKFMSDFYDDLQQSFDDLANDITNLTNNFDNYAIKNHASSETTYGLGTDELYGHLKLTESFDENDHYTLGDATSVSASAFHQFLHSGINNGDSYYTTIENINNDISDINTTINNINDDIQNLKDEDTEIHEEIDALDNRIDTLENLPLSYDTLVFSDNITINSEKKTYSTFICRGATENISVELSDVEENRQFTIKNETNHNVTITPVLGNTVDMHTMPIILGEYDSITLKQNPGETNINFTIVSSNTVLSHSEYLNASETSIEISMTNKDANYFDINNTNCAMLIRTANSNNSTNIEFSEKIVVLHAVVDTVITYPNFLVWMNTSQKPEWGDAGETLILKLLQVGQTVYATAMHNSQIVDDLDEGVKYSG